MEALKIVFTKKKKKRGGKNLEFNFIAIFQNFMSFFCVCWWGLFVLFLFVCWIVRIEQLLNTQQKENENQQQSEDQACLSIMTLKVTPFYLSIPVAKSYNIYRRSQKLLNG